MIPWVTLFADHCDNISVEDVRQSGGPAAVVLQNSRGARIKNIVYAGAGVPIVLINAIASEVTEVSGFTLTEAEVRALAEAVKQGGRPAFGFALRKIAASMLDEDLIDKFWEIFTRGSLL